MVRVEVINPFVSGRDNSQRVQPKHRLLIGNRLGQLGLPVGKWHQRLKIAVGLIEPVAFCIGCNAVKGNVGQFGVTQIGQLVRRQLHILPTSVVYAALAQTRLLSNKESDSNAGLYSKHIVRSAGDFRIAAHVRT